MSRVVVARHLIEMTKSGEPNRDLFRQLYENPQLDAVERRHHFRSLLCRAYLDNPWPNG